VTRHAAFANAREIAAWTGHHSLAEVAHYTADADRRKAVLGQAKRA